MADLRIVVASLRCDEYAIVVTRIDATVFAIAVTVGTDGSASGDVIDDDAVFIVAFVGRTIDARFPLELVIARNDGCAVAFGLAGFALWRGLWIGIGIGIGIGVGIDLRFGFALGDAVDEFANFGFGVARLRNGVFAVVVASEHVEIISTILGCIWWGWADRLFRRIWHRPRRLGTSCVWSNSRSR